jgi:Zn-dependent peptidase ImmA (M78 family)
MLTHYATSEQATKPDYRVARAKASQFAGAYSKPPIPVKDIIEAQGVDVLFVRFGSLGRDIAGVTNFNDAQILVNADDAFNRQTFTMAHEFGHWILHKHLFEREPAKYQVLLRRPTGTVNSDPVEKEANFFAANLLVPMRLLKPVKDIASKSELARMFAVSEQTIEYRLKYV